MATKPKATKKAAPRKKAPAKKTETPQHRDAGTVGKAPLGINDVRADDEAVLGHFVEVVNGEEKGAYGVFEEVEGDDAIVRTRDNDSRRIVVPIKDLIPAQAGRR